MEKHPTIRIRPRFATNAARPRWAFLLGWGLTSTAALAAWMVDTATRPSGTDGLQGLGAALAFLTLLIVIVVIGPWSAWYVPSSPGRASAVDGRRVALRTLRTSADDKKWSTMDRDNVTPPPFTPKLGHGRATAALVAAIGIVTVMLVVTLAMVVFIALTSIPPGCGFNAGDACTNPDANETSSEVLSVLVALGMAAATTWLVSATVGRVLGAAREALRRRVVAGFAAALVVALGAGPVLLIFATSQTDLRILIGAAIMLVVIVWPVIPCEVHHAARPSNPAPAEDSRP